MSGVRWEGRKIRRCMVCHLHAKNLSLRAFISHFFKRFFHINYLSNLRSDCITKFVTIKSLQQYHTWLYFDKKYFSFFIDFLMLYMVSFDVSTSSFTMFQLVYSWCFTMYGSNIAVDFDIMERTVTTKKPTYFGNPLLTEFVLFFVPQKMFHLVYSQCFTIYRSNVAVIWDTPLQQKNPHILETLY